jgi:hypothetical protein
MVVSGRRAVIHGPIACGTADDVDCSCIVQLVALKTARNLFLMVPPVSVKHRTVKHVTKHASMQQSSKQ